MTERFSENDSKGIIFPEDIYAVAYHRRFMKKHHYFFGPYQP